MPDPQATIADTTCAECGDRITDTRIWAGGRPGGPSLPYHPSCFEAMKARISPNQPFARERRIPMT